MRALGARAPAIPECQLQAMCLHVYASGPVSIDISDNPIPPQEVFEFCERNPKVKVSLTALPGTYARFTLSSLNGARPNIVQSYTCNSR